MASSKSSLTEFRDALQAESAAYGITLTSADLSSLSKYYELLEAWNARLHLVAPVSPQLFATRHVLESLLLLNYFPEGARIADVGSGAGLPIIPCLILRPDISAVLIESNQKKAIFLREALKTTPGLQATVLPQRFESIDAPAVDFVTCRALERFEEMLPQLISWSPRPGQLLLFGGEGLGAKIAELGLAATKSLIPKSQKRFLFQIINS